VPTAMGWVATLYSVKISVTRVGWNVAVAMAQDSNQGVQHEHRDRNL